MVHKCNCFLFALRIHSHLHCIGIGPLNICDCQRRGAGYVQRLVRNSYVAGGRGRHARFGFACVCSAKVEQSNTHVDECSN